MRTSRNCPRPTARWSTTPASEPPAGSRRPPKHDRLAPLAGGCMLGTTDPFTTFVGTLSFWVGAVASIAAAYLMVASIKNLIRAALALTTVLGAVAMMYALLGADFLAVSQLAIYIGAVMVLIMFAIFMTPARSTCPASSVAANASGRCSCH